MQEVARHYEGTLNAQGLKLALVVGRFNDFISNRLLDGALDAFTRHGGGAGDIEVAWVPGAFDMPLVARRLARSGKYDAVCCIGAVIRGGTPHFDHVAGQAARGVAQTAWDTGVPVVFGLLTTDTIEQAIERAGTKGGNKGFDAACSAIEMAQLMKSLPAEA